MTFKCYRCNRTFRSLSNLDQHVRDSPNHWICPVCATDNSTRDELLSHYRRAGCRTVCQGCNSGQGAGWLNNSQAYYEHLSDYNVCSDCEQHFGTPANLLAHQVTHRAADQECLGCYRKFRTYGGMIIHLESGACESGLDITDLNETAAKCYQWKQYINYDARDDMLGRFEIEEYDIALPYECPTCVGTFSKLSGLFQHVESPACDQTLDDGAIKKLIRYLEVRHG